MKAFSGNLLVATVVIATGLLGSQAESAPPAVPQVAVLIAQSLSESNPRIVDDAARLAQRANNVEAMLDVVQAYLNQGDLASARLNYDLARQLADHWAFGAGGDWTFGRAAITHIARFPGNLGADDRTRSWAQDATDRLNRQFNDGKPQVFESQSRAVGPWKYSNSSATITASFTQQGTNVFGSVNNSLGHTARFEANTFRLDPATGVIVVQGNLTLTSGPWQGQVHQYIMRLDLNHCNSIDVADDNGVGNVFRYQLSR